MILKLVRTSESSGGLVKTQIAGPTEFLIPVVGVKLEDFQFLHVLRFMKHTLKITVYEEINPEESKQ